MNCVCYNLMNRFQEHLTNLLTTLINNRMRSGTPSTDDGNYQPNLNLLEDNNTGSFDGNTFFYVFLILLGIVTLSSILSSRRGRRIRGNGSSLN